MVPFLPHPPAPTLRHFRGPGQGPRAGSTPETKKQRHPRGPLGPGTGPPRFRGGRGQRTEDPREEGTPGKAMAKGWPWALESHGGLEGDGGQRRLGVPPRQADAAEGLRLGLETGRCPFCRGHTTEGPGGSGRASGLGPRGSGGHMSQEGGLCHHSQQHQVVEQEGGGWRRGTQASLHLGSPGPHLGLPASAPSPAGQTELKLHC